MQATRSMVLSSIPAHRGWFSTLLSCLLLPQEPWSHLLGIFDDRWFVDTSIDTCMERVFR